MEHHEAILQMFFSSSMHACVSMCQTPVRPRPNLHLPTSPTRPTYLADVHVVSIQVVLTNSAYIGVEVQYSMSQPSEVRSRGCKSTSPLEAKAGGSVRGSAVRDPPQ